jgi:hypothetical protein
LRFLRIDIVKYIATKAIAQIITRVLII